MGFESSLTRIEEVGRSLQDDCRTKNFSLQDENLNSICEFLKFCSTKMKVLQDERGGYYPLFKGG